MDVLSCRFLSFPALQLAESYDQDCHTSRKVPKITWKCRISSMSSRKELCVVCSAECTAWTVDVVNSGGLWHQLTCFQWWGSVEASVWYWNKMQSVWCCQHAAEYSRSSAGECLMCNWLNCGIVAVLFLLSTVSLWMQSFLDLDSLLSVVVINIVAS